MFRIRLVLVPSAEKWVFRVGMTFRFVNLFTAVALLVAGFALDALAVAGGLAMLALLGALYEESASFDRATQRGEFRVGLVFLHRKRTFSLDDVAEVRVHTFGAAQFVGLEVGLRDGRVMTIENDRGKASTQRLSAWGAELAQWLGVPLTN